MKIVIVISIIFEYICCLWFCCFNSLCWYFLFTKTKQNYQHCIFFIHMQQMPFKSFLLWFLTFVLQNWNKVNFFFLLLKLCFVYCLFKISFFSHTAKTNPAKTVFISKFQRCQEIYTRKRFWKHFFQWKIIFQYSSVEKWFNSYYRKSKVILPIFC